MSSRALWTNKKTLARFAALLVCAAGLLATFRPATVWAQNSKQDGCLKDPVCRDRYNQALKLYDEGKYVEALPEFQGAYQRRQMPWLMLNIGRTLQRLGRPSEAITYYERYKKAELNMDQATLERVNKYIEQAQALVEKPPTENQPPSGTTTSPGTTSNPGTTTSPGTPANPGTAALNLNPQTGQPSDAPVSKPIYKKWWFWTIIGVVVAGGVAGGVAGALAGKKTPATDPITPGDPVYMPTF